MLNEISHVSKKCQGLLPEIEKQKKDLHTYDVFSLYIGIKNQYTIYSFGDRPHPSKNN